MKKLKDCLSHSKESHLFIVFLIGCMLCSELVSRAYSSSEGAKSTPKTAAMVDSSRILEDSAKNVKAMLITEVDAYMKNVSSKPKITAEHMVNVCTENEFDITLAISQAQLETHFGEFANSNSCFGVTSRRFKNANESVDHYVDLMQSKYLIERSVDDLIKSNFAQEKSPKHKYAKNSKYGSKVKSIRNDIIKKTQIHALYTQYSAIKKRLIRENSSRNPNYSIMIA